MRRKTQNTKVVGIRVQKVSSPKVAEYNKVRDTLKLFKPLYKKHLNKKIDYKDAEEIRYNLKGFGRAIKESLKTPKP